MKEETNLQFKFVTIRLTDFGHSVDQFYQIDSSSVFRPRFSLQRSNHGHPILSNIFIISFGSPQNLFCPNVLNKCIKCLFELLSSCPCNGSNRYLDWIHAPFISCAIIMQALLDLHSPKMVKEIQKLTRMIAALSCFVACSTDK